jgi:hypothetical protein
VIAQAVNPVRNPGGEFISNGVNLMNFLLAAFGRALFSIVFKEGK